MTRSQTALLGAALVLALPACAGGGKDAPRADVRVKLLAFAPERLTVKAGTTVTWTDDEPVTHTVTSGTVAGVDATSGLRASESPDGTFDGRLAGAGATFAHRFADPGEFSYFCSIHKAMNATVVVTS